MCENKLSKHHLAAVQQLEKENPWTETVLCLPLGEEQAAPGHFHLHLSEHDGERLDDQRTQPERDWQR